MQFRTVTFNVEELCFQRVNHRFDPYRNVNVDTYTAKFVRGEQVRLDSKEIKNSVFHDEPAQTVDYLKTWITKVFPRLKFKWLIPETKQVEQIVSQTCESTYYNIMPLPKEFSYNEYSEKHIQMYERLGGQELFSESDFLMAEPCTQDEIVEARKAKYLKGHELAMFYV